MKTKRFYFSGLFTAAMMFILGCSDKNEPIIVENDFTITVTSDSNGKAEANTETSKPGKTITVTAFPNDGCTFSQWLVEEGNVILSPNIHSNPATFVMPDSNVSLKAEFKMQYSVSVTANENGTASADNQTAEPGTVVTIVAVPDKGCIFKQWTVENSNVDISPDIYSDTATFIMPEDNVSILAEFDSFIELVRIPAGTFLMGSPSDEPGRTANETQHNVTLTEDFLIGKYEITNAQYAAFLNKTGVPESGQFEFPGNGTVQFILQSFGDQDYGLHYTDGKWEPVAGYENHPAMMVSWFGATAFAKWAGGALPTEAQWEYACRGDNGTLPFGIGDGKKLDGTMANFYGTYPYDLDKGGRYEDLNGIFPYTTTPVGYYEDYPNSYGLYDMHGNMWEWCSDYFDTAYGNGAADATNPTGPTGGSNHVLKGGGWTRTGDGCRSAMRLEGQPQNTYNYYGFRVVFKP